MFAGFEDGGGVMWTVQAGTGHVLRGQQMCPRHPDDENRVTLEGWSLRPDYFVDALGEDT